MEGLCPGVGRVDCLCPEGLSVRERVSVQEGSVQGDFCLGGLCRRSPQRIRNAGGTHPTGMLSCNF